MFKISEIMGLLVLAVLSVKDMKMRRVPVSILIISGLASLVYQICIREMSWKLILGGAAVGGIFLLISRVTREGVGYGDSIGIIILGSFLGFFRILAVLSITFFILFFFSIPILCRKKMSKKYALPFYPFLTAGYLCLVCIEGMDL